MPPRPLPVLLSFFTLLCLLSQVQAQPDLEGKVSISTKFSEPAAAPGDQLALAVIFDHAPGWHIHTNAPVIPKELGDFPAIPTDIRILSISGARAGPIQWPPVHTVQVRYGADASPIPYGVFEGRAIAYIPLIIDPAAAGGASITIGVGYQPCDDTTCYAPVFPDDPASQYSVTIPIGPGAGAGPADPDFSAFDPAIFAAMHEGTAPAPAIGPADAPAQSTRDFGAFGLNLNIDTRGPLSFFLILLVAILGGFVLNLTPCVLPVVPIKILGLSQAAGNPARCFYLGMVMSLGVITFWLAIGAAIAFISGFDAISSLFKTPWFALAVGVFIAFMAVGMLGLFTIQLPQFVYAVSPNHETARGSFIFGVMTAILSTPCTAPFMGSAAAWAATQHSAITLSTFAAIGLGMALPYLLLSANPRWVSKVPRTGPASELVKQVMGIFMVAVAVFFFGLGLTALIPGTPAWARSWYWWAVALFISVGAFWMTLRTFQISRAPGKRLAITIAGLTLVAGSTFAAWKITLGNRGIPWQPYSAELVEAALEDGKVVVLDFTAEWCLNCKAIEAAVLYRAEVIKALNDPAVVPVKVDLTAPRAAGWQKLRELDEVGIPLLAVYGPGLVEPFKSNAYTPDMVIQAVARARGQ